MDLVHDLSWNVTQAEPFLDEHTNIHICNYYMYQLNKQGLAIMTAK